MVPDYSPAQASELPVLPSAPLDSPSLVVFTDVDGVLRDAASRSWEEARAALDLLASHGVPLVLASGQSSAELLRLQQELGVTQPFICEHGAALFIPNGYFADLPRLGSRIGDWEVIAFGEPRDVVCEALYQLADRLQVPVSGFSRWTVDDLARQEGLARLDAQLALQRQFDEPFRFDPGLGPREQARLFDAMHRAGFRCFSGPRYQHASGVQDPGHAIRLLISLYRLGGDPVLAVGVGDDWSDRLMLREVDVPVVVRNASVDQRRLLRSLPAAYLTDAAGPAGWSEAILGSFAV